MTRRRAREDWEALARDLDWTPRYASEAALFPAAQAGGPWLPAREAVESWQQRWAPEVDAAVVALQGVGPTAAPA